ncbi:MAG: SAM-dependent chlorinase/fluorinase [Acidobacteriales bacterium]|nr:SAM-dependent chlorinase/fluorinase [Terriglobales bacterium]
MGRPVITLTTDFGLEDHFVGVMKGVILRVAPEAEIVDITHAVTAFDIMDGALTLAAAYRYFPAHAIHVVVVDPGVGSVRRPILVRAGGYRFVAPDNGVLSAVYAREKDLRAWHVTSKQYFLQPVSNTFHGRDVFAPVAAYVAAGVAPEAFGPEIKDCVRLPLPKPALEGTNTIRGAVLMIDRFGNLMTNIRPEDAPQVFEGRKVRICIGAREITSIRSSYAESESGELFGILGSSGVLEIAANRASAEQITVASAGDEVTVTWE